MLCGTAAGDRGWEMQTKVTAVGSTGELGELGLIWSLALVLNTLVLCCYIDRWRQEWFPRDHCVKGEYE